MVIMIIIGNLLRWMFRHPIVGGVIATLTGIYFQLTNQLPLFISETLFTRSTIDPLVSAFFLFYRSKQP